MDEDIFKSRCFCLNFCLNFLNSMQRSRALVSVSQYLVSFCWVWSSLVCFPGFTSLSPVRGCRVKTMPSLRPETFLFCWQTCTQRLRWMFPADGDRSLYYSVSVWSLSLSLGWGRKQWDRHRGMFGGVSVQMFLFAGTYIISLVEKYIQREGWEVVRFENDVCASMIALFSWMLTRCDD